VAQGVLWKRLYDCPVRGDELAVHSACRDGIGPVHFVSFGAPRRMPCTRGGPRQIKCMDNTDCILLHIHRIQILADARAFAGALRRYWPAATARTLGGERIEIPVRIKTNPVVLSGYCAGVFLIKLHATSPERASGSVAGVILWLVIWVVGSVRKRLQNGS
jgi:hypothetical protein